MSIGQGHMQFGTMNTTLQNFGRDRDARHPDIYISLGILGGLVDSLFVHRKVQTIFTLREQQIKMLLQTVR